MGADGSILIVKRDDWVERFGSLDPLDFGFNIGFMLDVDAVWGYSGEILYPLCLQAGGADAQYGPAEDNRTDQEKEVANWFLNNAETHEVWS